MITGWRARVQALRRGRELSSAERAGAWSRQQARELQLAFLRRHQWLFAVAALVIVAATPLALLLPASVRGLVVGAWVTGAFGFLAHWVVVASGSVRFVMAHQGEQWTRDELQPTRKDGWRIVHRVRFRSFGDIDSVALGPAGLVVVETKWAAKRWSSPDQQRWIPHAVAQARDNLQLVEHQIRQQIGAVPSRAAVVLWPADSELVTREQDGVTVLRGTELRGWVKGLPPASLDRARLDLAWTFLDAHVAGRDAFEQAQHGTEPRSLTRFLLDLMQFPLGALAGLIVGVAAASLGGPWMLIPCALSAVLAVRAARDEAVRRFVLSAAVAVVGLSIWLAVMVALDAVRG